MFTQITLKNYKSHKLTTIDLSPITLLIGNNNSGKSNLLSGIQHFSDLIRRGRLENRLEDKKLKLIDIVPYRYRLAAEGEPIGFTVLWSRSQGNITYEIELYDIPSFIEYPYQSYLGHCSCVERISIKLENGEEKKLASGDDKKTDLFALRQIIEKNYSSLERLERDLSQAFFIDFDNTFCYHFQPTFLKILAKDNQITEENDSENKVEKRDFEIAAELGNTGFGLQALVKYIKVNKESTFTRFMALLRRLEINFQGVRYSEHLSQLIWGFDLAQKGVVEEFTSDSVSDGFMKAAAISLLASLDRPPTLILLEEIENGINPGNIQELMRWIWQMTSSNSEGLTTQFIITSHSPSVLREFHNHLDHVYTVRLQKRDRTSDVRNLNTSLDTLVGIGTVEGEIIEDETTGKRTVEIPKYQLAELWYSGTIG